MVSEGRKPAWMLALWGQAILLYRHFYRQKTSAFARAGDGLGLLGSYSSASIINDGRGLLQQAASAQTTTLGEVAKEASGAKQFR
jgi:hypothetical protein